jgi:hypothetical protein
MRRSLDRGTQMGYNTPMKGSEQTVEVGDIWEYAGNSFRPPYLILIIDIYNSTIKSVPSSVYYETLGKYNTKSNITISYLYKEYRKIS